MNYKSPKLTVDGIILKNGKILLIKRGNEPFKGKWALPGGFVEYGEKTEDAVVREVFEETGLKTKIKDLVGVFSDPDRDPRGHVVSIAFFVQHIGGKLSAGSDAQYAQSFQVPPKDLAFDHYDILLAAGVVMGGEDRKTH